MYIYVSHVSKLFTEDSELRLWFLKVNKLKENSLLIFNFGGSGALPQTFLVFHPTTTEIRHSASPWRESDGRTTM